MTAVEEAVEPDVADDEVEPVEPNRAERRKARRRWPEKSKHAYMTAEGSRLGYGEEGFGSLVWRHYTRSRSFAADRRRVRKAQRAARKVNR